jgi:hypothetical protein
MEKPRTLIFCNTDTDAGEVLAKSLRTGKNSVVMCKATPYIYVAEAHEAVFIMPDVDAKCRETIRRIYPVSKDVMKEVVPDHIKKQATRKSMAA